MDETKKNTEELGVEESPVVMDEVAAGEPEEEACEQTVPKSELEAAEKAATELKDKYLRTVAEYDNFRKRTAREREALFGDATASSVAAFLAVYDNLERAIENPTTDEAYKKGVELIFAQFCDVLAKLNVEIISPLGESFDPNFHNAVMHEDDPEAGESVVTEVFQKGFKLGNRVIRPAFVKVAN